jgi:hypothetical protein
VMNQFYSIVQHQGTSLARLHEAFTAWWLPLLASHHSTAPASYAAARREEAVAA